LGQTNPEENIILSIKAYSKHLTYIQANLLACIKYPSRVGRRRAKSLVVHASIAWSAGYG